MQDVWDYIRDNPWLWLLFAVGTASWIASIAVIVTSSKFLRKWLWFFLSLFSFSYAWGISDDTTIGISFPIGSLYILWFWRFGRPPTPEEIARHGARRSANTSSLLMVRFLGAIYLGAAVAFAVIGWLIASGAAVDFITTIHQPTLRSPSRMVLFLPKAVVFGLDALDATFVFLMLFLAYRPYWWGKIICLWAGLAWVGFAVTASYFYFQTSLVPVAVFICGVFMIAVAVAHQIVDPRFGGSYLRVATV
jgi:hypothetical protein